MDDPLLFQVSDLPSLARTLKMDGGKIDKDELRSGNRKRQVVKARKLFCQLAVKKMGYSGAEVARFLGVTTSAVNRLANAEELPELKQYV
jgi:hypothetical protein